jgi:Rad52/22 family double-strand break repair protein
VTYFSDEQVKLLLTRIHPNRVLVRDGMSYVEGYDIRAELTRIFGFGRWSSELLDQEVICETEVTTKTYTDKYGKEKGGKPAWYVVYRSRVRLTVFAPDGTMVTFHDGSHVGESTHPVRGEAHGNALTNSETYALRRAAINLGDQFGLSLYNKGSMDAIVRWTLVRPEAGAETGATDTDDVPQVSAEDAGTGSSSGEEESGGTVFDSAEPPPAPAAAEPGPADAGDLWERPWLDVATGTAATFKAKADGQKLWREAAAKAHAGECTAADAQRIQELITARLEDLAKAARPSLAAAARLDPGDDWTAKLDEIGDDEEAARRVLAELAEARRMPAAKGHNIRTAITERFPALDADRAAA